MVKSYSLFSDFDLSLFAAGKHFKLYEKFGSHLVTLDGEDGCYFSVYAPGAKCIEVIGDFNYWGGTDHRLHVRWDQSGIWEGFIPGIKQGELYKYKIYSHHDEEIREKADPFARLYETPPNSASVVWSNNTNWKDKTWMSTRSKNNALDQPISVYEVHIGSWMKRSSSQSLSYVELAKELTDYLLKMKYTHVEFMPVMEHPYYPSWGYLCTGYFAPSSRYGDPDQFKILVDTLHQNDIGVILDWVPAHFPSDEHALADFDGTKLYEHPELAKGFHPDWNSLIFNFERPQIRSFLISSAHFWFEYYHADGIRVDAVASMIYLDYSREEGQWSPNIHGGNEYLAAIELLKDLNASVYRDFPDILMIAEESTAFNGVTRPVDAGGLGFGLKWMMGWMNDTLEYFSRDPIHRTFHHGDISRSLTYAFSENYMLPLSHDEVVHGKQSIIYKMPGDEWQKFANLRLLYTYMYTHPGQKLLFMGDDIAQTSEWNVDDGTAWDLLQYPSHQGVQTLVQNLNTVYRNEKALYGDNYKNSGFEWIDYSDSKNTVLSYIRKCGDDFVVIVLNFTPTPLDNYRVGVPVAKSYKKIMDSDAPQYWGSNYAQQESYKLSNTASHGKKQSITLNIPPLAGIILKPKIS